MTADRWPVMLAQLLGEPLPPLPAVQGRVHRGPEVPARPEPTEAELATAAIWRRLAGLPPKRNEPDSGWKPRVLSGPRAWKGPRP